MCGECSHVILAINRIMEVLCMKKITAEKLFWRLTSLCGFGCFIFISIPTLRKLSNSDCITFVLVFAALGGISGGVSIILWIIKKRKNIPNTKKQ